MRLPEIPDICFTVLREIRASSEAISGRTFRMPSRILTAAGSADMSLSISPSRLSK